jgi:hypothetical protein
VTDAASAAPAIAARRRALARRVARGTPAGVRGLAALLDGFDALVPGAGGCVSLDDARLRPPAPRPALDLAGAMRAELARRPELA